MARLSVLILVTVLVLGGLFVALRPDAPDGGPGQRTVEVELQKETMSPAEVTVGEGAQVILRFTADQPRELHLHGYDREAEVRPGETAMLSFEATRTGSFDVEDHETEVTLGELIVEPRR